MKDVDFPVWAVPNGDKPRIMYPNEEHYFPNSNKVREIPMKPKYKKGGKLDHTKALQAYLESLPEEEQDKFVDHYDSLSDNDKDDLVTQMVMRDGGIHIDHKNKGKFNATKERTGKTTEELTHSKNPLTRKRAIFAQVSRSWHKKQEGGSIPTYPQIPDNQANVEVENLETVKLPNGELNKFEGPSHAQGGIPTNLPEGSKIFSHYLKPDPKIVETVLGKKAKPGLSYADLSKKFPTKKWENILNNPDADSFQKNTAQVKLEKNKAMLETIFQAQELDKGINTDQQYMQEGGQIDLSGISNRFQQLPNGLIIDPVTNKQMKRLADGRYQVVGDIPEIREKEKRPFPQIETDKTRVQINPKPLDPFQNFINEQQNPASSYTPTTSDKFPSLRTETVIPELNYSGKDSLPARNTVAEPDKT
ncbi:MAG: hypothetical protein EB127_28620, partial [Alphaproteobacteria bacterium]|nr:hypothetical protein [Alphaproteobacteria bacterium]